MVHKMDIYHQEPMYGEEDVQSYCTSTSGIWNSSSIITYLLIITWKLKHLRVSISKQQSSYQLCKTSHEEGLVSLKLPTLVCQRKRGDTIATCKLLENNISSQVFPPSLTSKTRGHTTKLQVLCCHQQKHQQFFSVHTFLYWNSLSKVTIPSQAIHAFKKGANQDWANAECRFTWDARQ